MKKSSVTKKKESADLRSSENGLSTVTLTKLQKNFDNEEILRKTIFTSKLGFFEINNWH